MVSRTRIKRDKDQARFAELYKQDMLIKNICIEMGISSTTAARWAQQLNLRRFRKVQAGTIHLYMDAQMYHALKHKSIELEVTMAALAKRILRKYLFP